MQENNILQIQNDLERVFMKANVMSPATHFMLSDIFDIFLDLVFIKAILTLELEDQTDINNEWKKIISISEPKYYILHRTHF